MMAVVVDRRDLAVLDEFEAEWLSGETLDVLLAWVKEAARTFLAAGGT